MPGLPCKAACASHSTINAAGNTARPLITCDSRNGSAATLTSRSKAKFARGRIITLTEVDFPAGVMDIDAAVAIAGASTSFAGASASTSTAPRPAEQISRTKNSAPAAGSINPTPSASNSLRRPGVTMPPFHGPQLTETTRHAGRCRDSRCANLLSTSLAAA